MIINLLLSMLTGLCNVILSPLSLLNITVDFIAKMTTFISFIEVVAYIIPWGNILPLLILSIGIVTWKVGVSVVKTIWQLIPFL